MKNIAKKALGVSLLAGTLGVAGYAATPDWIVTDAGDGKVTYSITADGAFTFDDLGVAAIKNGESFSLEVEVSASTFANSWGTGIIGTPSAYNSNGDNNQFRIYVGSGSNTQRFVLNINNWTYGSFSGDGVTELSNLSYGVPDDPSSENPLKLAFKLEYLNNTDAGGNDFFRFSALEGSQITFDALQDSNCVRTFNFSSLTNEGAPELDFEGTSTTIRITKAGAIPEPSAFGLLAGAGALALVAARRRRRKA